MVTLNTSFRRPPRHSRRFPFDTLGAIALAWAGVFITLAFVLGEWLG